MVALIFCKSKEDPINNEGVRVVTTLYIDFQTLKGSSLRSRQSDLAKFKLIQTFMVILDTCKNEEDPSKYEGTRVDTTFLPL